MGYLLDTHIFLWWLEGNKKLGPAIRKLINNPKNQIFVSVASAWEISIKHRVGKLPLKTTVETYFKASRFDVLPIDLKAILALEKLPLHHKDPFDRMLIAQARVEKLILLTKDPKMKQYDVEFIT